MQNLIEDYFKHPIVKKTYENYNLLWEANSNYPYLNYFGINFDDEGICSFKLYFACFHKITKEEAALFLPHTNDFLKYYHLWEPSLIKTLEHSGCTFEIKFKRGLDPVLGFHYRLKPTKEAYDLIGYPKLIPFDVLSLGTRPGINYEYEGDHVLRKQYYYLDKPEHKHFFAQRFKNDYFNKIHLIEYTEANSFAKINAWKFDLSKENLNRPSPFNKKAQLIINEIQEKYGLINISDGYYENSSTRASYYFNIQQTSTAPFDDKENFNIDTIKIFL